MTADTLPVELRRALVRLARTPRLLVACDYDGTLAPIIEDPDRALPRPESVTALRALASLAATTVAVISGRALRDLATLSRLPSEVHLVGSHGAEFDVGFVNALEPAEETLLEELHTELAHLVADAKGVSLEAKPASVAVARQAGAHRGRRGELAPPPLPHPGRRSYRQEDRVGHSRGRTLPTLDTFFDQLGSDRAAALEAMSMDIGASFNKSVRTEGHTPQAVISRRPIPRASRSSPTPWTPCAARPATSCAHCPTRPRPRAPAGPAQATGEPHRGAVEHAAQAAPPRWGPVAAYSLKGCLPGDLRQGPRRRADHRADRPLMLEGQPLPTPRVRQGRQDHRQDHPRVPRRHPRRHPPRGEQRPRRTQQSRPPDHCAWVYGFHSAKAALALVMLSCGTRSSCSYPTRNLHDDSHSCWESLFRWWCPGALRSLRGRVSQVKGAYGVASDGAARHP